KPPPTVGSPSRGFQSPSPPRRSLNTANLTERPIRGGGTPPENTCSPDRAIVPSPKNSSSIVTRFFERLLFIFSQFPFILPCWITKSADVRGKQLLEATGRKPLRIILPSARTQMLLVKAVIVVAKFVHENMQKHERPRLRLSEAARDGICSTVV